MGRAGGGPTRHAHRIENQDGDADALDHEDSFGDPTADRHADADRKPHAHQNTNADADQSRDGYAQRYANANSYEDCLGYEEPVCYPLSDRHEDGGDN